MKNNLLYGIIGVLATLLIVLGIFAIVQSQSKTVVLKVDGINAPSDPQLLGNIRNDQRSSDVNTILNAVYNYSIDHGGNLPPSIPTTPTEICRSPAAICSAAALPANECRSEGADCTGLVDIDAFIDPYLTFGGLRYTLPRDPTAKDSRSTKYTIAQFATGHIVVAAPDAENGKVISVRR